MSSLCILILYIISSRICANVLLFAKCNFFNYLVAKKIYKNNNEEEEDNNSNNNFRNAEEGSMMYHI